jgi:heat shock protein HslJ
MTSENWLKYGAIALFAVGSLVVIGISFASGDSLEGEAWVVSGTDAGSGAVQPLAGTVITAIFDDGSLSGTSGCNSYFASYSVDADSIGIGPIGSTLAFCGEPEGVMDQEAAYLSLLEDADRYERDDDSLTLLQGDTVLIVYHAARPELYNN